MRNVFCIVILLSVVFYAGWSFAASPLVYYKLDGNMDDSSGNVQNGWLADTGTAGHWVQGGAPGTSPLQSKSFAPVDESDSSYVAYFPASHMPSPASAFEIDFWIKPSHVSSDVVDTYNCLFYNRDWNAAMEGIEISVTHMSRYGGRIYFELDTSDTQFWGRTPHVIRNNNWNHVVCSWDGATAYIYVNDFPWAKFAATGTMSSAVPMTVGAQHDTAGVPVHYNPVHYYTGLLDEVTIYDTSTVTPPADSETIALYFFDNSLEDASGNDLHGAFLDNPDSPGHYSGEKPWPVYPDNYSLNVDPGQLWAAVLTPDSADFYDTPAVTSIFTRLAYGFTVEAWVKLDSLAGGTVVFKRNVNTDEPVSSWYAGWELDVLIGGQLYFQVSNEYVNSIVGSYAKGKLTAPIETALGIDQWYHVAASYESGSQKIYLNGQEIASKDEATGPIWCYNDLAIGYRDYGLYYHNGLIDEVRLTAGVLDTGSLGYWDTLHERSFGIMTVLLSDGVQWRGYGETIAVTDGYETYTFTWSIVSGDLPTGLTLDSNTGIISGTSNQSGTYEFVVQAVSGDLSDTAILTIIVNTNSNEVDLAGSGWHLFSPIPAGSTYSWADAVVGKVGVGAKSPAEAEAAGWMQGAIYEFPNPLQAFATKDDSDTLINSNQGYWLYAVDNNLKVTVE